MWKMIENDVLGRYAPSPDRKTNAKLRIVVITDGEDVESPGNYRGIRGMDPMMKTLLQAGFNIEWHIVVIDSSWFGGDSKESLRRYESLARATGGGFLLLKPFDNNGSNSSTDRINKEVGNFISTLELSGTTGDDSSMDRNSPQRRKELYASEAKRGRADSFEWLKLLP